MNNCLAPIILFVYNRPWHTRQTLEALNKNFLADKSKLYIFSDGPKQNADKEQLKRINEVRAVIRERNWCESVEIIEHEKNLGIELSVVSAITEKINVYGKVIVLEDDLVTSNGFLTFMNNGLNTYENVNSVFGISGYMFPVSATKQEMVLLPVTFLWGWATWKHKWEFFDQEMKYANVISSNTFLSNRFNLGNYSYTQLFNHIDKPWDIRWYYSIFVRNGLFVHPVMSLVKNIGMDGSGTHYDKDYSLDEQALTNKIPEVKILNCIDMDFYSKVINYFELKNLSLIEKFVKRLKRALKY